MPISATEFEVGAASAAPTIPTTSEKPPATGSDGLSQTSADALLGQADGSEPVQAPEASQTPSDEPYGVATNVTPSGIEVYYQAGPKRLYRVRYTGCAPSDLCPPEGCAECQYHDWVEVPSVTTILEVLDKSGALTWWGMKIGVDGVLELLNRGRLGAAPHLSGQFGLIVHEAGYSEWATLDRIVGNRELEIKGLLTEEKLTVNHVKEEAGDRGTNVHSAFEQWATDARIMPQPAVFPDEEKPYVEALAMFLRELAAGGPTDVQAEVMVGSAKHGFAGRYDLRLVLQEPVEVTTRLYPKKANKREVIPAGRYLLDLKTSKSVYDTHFLQMEAYEAASIECGYEPTDHRAVIHVTKNGEYELARNVTKDGELYATIDDYVDVKRAHSAVARINGRKRG